MPEIAFEDSMVPDNAALVGLYGSAGWSNYTDSPETLAAAMAGSAKVVSAWSEEQLVGLARVISDRASV